MNRLPALDSLRALAILMVIGGHIATHYQPLDEDSRSWLLAFANPDQGVRLFFALSGYLITHLLMVERDRHGTVRLSRFYLRRSRRILPAYLVFLGGIALWMLFIRPGAILWSHWWAALTFSWNYALPWLPPRTPDTWLLGHTWSLAVEAQFYLLWPLVLIRFGPDRALRLALWCLALQPGLRIATYLLAPDLRGYLGMMLHTGADGLLAGCALALLVRRSDFRAWFLRHVRIWIALGLFWMFIGGPLCSHSIRGFPMLLGYTFSALAAALVTASLHLSPPPSCRRWLEAGLLPAIGLWSYSLYLWQQVFLHAEMGLAQGRIALPLLATLIAGLLSYRFVETPFLTAKSAPRKIAGHQS